jgi:predicted pyridoxine 5'-phosphate oxidase superfamily flavin-nucleotide-binding protein
MGTVHPAITPPVAAWIRQQHMFFVASAPLDGDGHVNVSPKGDDTLRILDDLTVAYLDLTGSGAETVAHVRENGRVTLMWCAFAGPPRIVRVHGRGEILAVDDERVAGLFDAIPGARAVVLVHADRVSDSCGYSVPLYTYDGERSRLRDWADQRGPEGLAAYWAQKNAESIDGLPAIVSD